MWESHKEAGDYWRLSIIRKLPEFRGKYCNTNVTGQYNNMITVNVYTFDTANFYNLPFFVVGMHEATPRQGNN
jgi:hypothetical protein